MTVVTLAGGGGDDKMGDTPVFLRPMHNNFALFADFLFFVDHVSCRQ